MRIVPKGVRDVIVDILPKDITDAIYVFGSYGTEYYQDGHSDIDIGWFVNYDIDWFEAMDYKDILEDKLNMKVDLILAQRKNTPITISILEGEYIGEISDDFSKWFDDFYDDNYDDIVFMDRYLKERCGIYGTTRL